MNWLRKIYLKIEGFGIKQPIATSIILAVALPIFVALLPDLGFKKQLFKEYSVSGFVILETAIIVVSLMATLLIHRRENVSRKSLLRRIHALLEKLNTPFERESIPLGGGRAYKEKFFDYEMMNLFDDYNRILSEVKSKWRTILSWPPFIFLGSRTRPLRGPQKEYAEGTAFTRAGPWPSIFFAFANL